MLPVTTRAGLSFRNGQHGFHRDHHIRFKNGVDVLAQFQPRFAAVVMGQYAERMSVSKCAVLQKIERGKMRIDLSTDVRAAGTGLDQR